MTRAITPAAAALLITSATLAGFAAGATPSTASPSAAGATRATTRPAAEHVPLSVHKAVLVRSDSPLTTTTKRRTVTGKTAEHLVRAFDGLHLERSGIRCDIAGGPQDKITFRTPAHTWVITEAACTDVVVTRDGTSLPTLAADEAWDNAVIADLS